MIVCRPYEKIYVGMTIPKTVFPDAVPGYSFSLSNFVLPGTSQVQHLVQIERRATLDNIERGHNLDNTWTEKNRSVLLRGLNPVKFIF